MRKGTVRKIVALGAGLTMLGATIFGATAAADLSQYPSPLFIQDGKFAGNIVVGKSAATDDVLGAIEMAAALQTAAVKKVPVAGAAGQTASVDIENAKIRQTGREFTYNSSINDVLGGVLDSSDLPMLLKSGTFNDNEGNNKEDQTYTQQLAFLSTTGILEFKAAEDVYSEAADSYLWWTDGSNKYMYIYTLDFDTAITYDNTSATTAADDLENTVLEIQGNKYTITDAHMTGGRIDKMELLAGETVVWMSQGEPLTRTINGANHEVILNDVNENEDKCGISVDGVVKWVDKGSTETINGLEVGVTDAITVHSAGKDTDVCEVNVGATKVTVENNAEVKRDDTGVDGSNAMFRFANSGATAKWDGFNITYVPDDTVYLKAGDKYVDPVMQNFQFDFAGMSQVSEELKWSRTGRTASVEFNNYDGKKIEINWKLNSSDNVTLGKDTDKHLLREGDEVTCGTASTDCENQQLFVVTSGNVIHIVEIKKIDTTNNKMDLRDVTYDVDYKDKDYTVGTSTSVDLGSLGTIGLLVTARGHVKATDLVLSSGSAYTKYKAIVAANPDETVGNTTSFVLPPVFTVSENTDKLETSITNAVVWHINSTIDKTDHEVDWATPEAVRSTSSIWVSSAIDKNEDDSDTQYMASEWGTIASWDAKDHTKGNMLIPEEQAYANAFLSKIGAVVSTGSGVEAVEFQQIQVGTAKLDSDIVDVAAQNLIVVGGPCVNSVAAKLMGNPADCTAGFKAGEATIKLYTQTTGKVALLVAGYSAMDTQRACKVLSTYKDNAATLKGSEVKVTGTTLTDIKVSAVTA